MPIDAEVCYLVSSSPMQSSPDPLPAAGSAPDLIRFVTSTALVFVVCYVGVIAAVDSPHVLSPVWPASGVIFGIMLLWGRRMIPAIYIGIVASNAFWDFAAPMTWLGPLGSIFEAAATLAILKRRLGPRPRLIDPCSCAAFMLWAPWLPVFLNSLYGFTLLYLGETVALHEWSREIPTFIAANGSGLVLIGCAFAVWQNPPSARWWKFFAALLLLTLALSVPALWLPSPTPPYLLLLPLLLAAVTLGLRATAPLLAIVTLTASLAALYDVGPLSAASDNFVPLYTFLAIIAAASMPVAATCESLRTRSELIARSARTARLIFWSWSTRDGLLLDDGANPLILTRPPDPAGAFYDTQSDHGLRETVLGEKNMASSWTIAARDADGKPLAAEGVLFDLSDHQAREATRRLSWKSEVELRNLRASLAPHLLFNCLAAVRGIIRTDPDRARAFIDRLASFLRESTNTQSRETIPLLEEWQLCDNFLSLQSMRYERELPRVVDIEGAAFHALVPPMILLNLVENAVKHGIIDTIRPIVINGHLHDTTLHVSVRNHGPLGPTPAGRPGGLGIARARLQAIYGDDAKLEIHPSGEDVVAWFEIPARPPDKLPS